MKNILSAAAMTVLLGASASYAADTKVLDHHVANMKSGDLEAVLSDYAPDAVVVTPAGMVWPSGVFIAKDARKLFSVLPPRDNLPANKPRETKYEPLSA